MAGGVGSRFWPSSTQKNPKQFLDILGIGHTLLQLSYQRARKIFDAENILIVTNIEYIDLVSAQLPELPKQNILAEPMRRNTAPCIAYAAFKIKKLCPTATMVVTPSDHLITDDAAYEQVLRTALEVSQEHNFLITLGITPTKPETGYGYIQFSEPAKPVHKDIKKVKTFTEKPNLEHAKIFIESGEFLWNSGLFIWNVDTVLNGIEKYLPDLYQQFNEGWDTYNTDAEEAFIANTYPQCENVSIDYGLMEKSHNVYVFPASFGWSDLGTWSAIDEKVAHDTHGNALLGKKIITYHTENTLVVSQHKKVVVIDGLSDYIVVDTAKALLIFPKHKEQEIRSVVNDVRAKWGDEHV